MKPFTYRLFSTESPVKKSLFLKKKAQLIIETTSMGFLYFLLASVTKHFKTFTLSNNCTQVYAIKMIMYHVDDRIIFENCAYKVITIFCI